MSDMAEVGPAPDLRGELRTKLHHMRAELVEMLIRKGVPDGGMIALLGSVGAALEALDRAPVEAEPADRAVVSDDGYRTVLTLYRENGAAAAVELNPEHAVELARRLLEASSARLWRTAVEVRAGTMAPRSAAGA
jgi:hypothetical protein